LYILVFTKYEHIKSTTVYAPRRNWDSPQPPTRRLVCPLPLFLGGGEHSLVRKGLGESQFRRGPYTVVLFICTYFVLVSMQFRKFVHFLESVGKWGDLFIYANIGYQRKCISVKIFDIFVNFREHSDLRDI
jgi:hypothetical protein